MLQPKITKLLLQEGEGDGNGDGDDYDDNNDHNNNINNNVKHNYDDNNNNNEMFLQNFFLFSVAKIFIVIYFGIGATILKP